METRQIRLADGRSIKFDVDHKAGAANYFVLGVRKSGSSIMNSMMESLARINGRNYVGIAGRLFGQNIPEKDWRTDPAVLQLFAPGNVYGGFRAMPLVFEQSPVFQAARKILLVRDPRDALVSEYFSNAYSHSLPGKGAASAGGAREQMLNLREAALATRIEDYVLSRAKPLNQTLMEYAAVARDKQTRLFRYEEVIFDKRGWLRDIAAHFSWTAGSPAFLDGMMSWADVVPTAERNTEFVRKVTPGDHKDKLGPETIAKLDALLREPMRIFGYA